MQDHSIIAIPPVDRAPQSGIQNRIDQKTKPPGALGQLEQLALQLALIHRNPARLSVNAPVMAVFAADHGIARHPVSIAPQAVTRQMVLNFLSGGAAVNCFCRANNIQLKVVDAGIIDPVESDHPDYISARTGAGTQDMSEGPAMTEAQATDALNMGMRFGRTLCTQGHDLIAFGEMGIGNTSSASALLSLLMKLPPENTVGAGTGITADQKQLKTDLIRKTLTRINARHAHPSTMEILQEAGGFEIAQMAGAMLGAAEAGRPLLIDGFIVSVAALIATRLAPECRDYMIFAHRSAEAGHQHVLEALQAEALLDLGLRLGEGTGAALAVPLVKAACAFYNDMATFDSAGVTV